MGAVFLYAVAALYGVFAAWCTLQPATTSDSLGLALKPGSGDSEYMTVYGGLEFGMALVFLVAALDAKTVPFGLQACWLLHGGIVLFRAASFLRFAGIGQMTYIMSGLEAAVFAVALLLWLRTPTP